MLFATLRNTDDASWRLIPDVEFRLHSNSLLTKLANQAKANDNR